MCPGCMTAAALLELGDNPASELIALIARALPRRTGTKPSTEAEGAKDQASEEQNGVD